MEDRISIGRKIKFLIPPSYELIDGKVMELRSDGRYKIQILSSPLKYKYPQGMIDVPEEDIVWGLQDLTRTRAKKRKPTNVKRKTCSCKKK